MGAAMEVPRISDLAGLPVEVAVPGEHGVVSLTASANDGSVVTLTWDEVARSVHVRWTAGGEERLVIERETVSRVSVRVESGRVEFWIWSRAGDIGGTLVIRVGEAVHMSDALLRR